MPSYSPDSEDDFGEWDKTKWPKPIPEYMKPKPGQPTINVICLICKKPIGKALEEKNMAMCHQCQKAIEEAEKNFQNTLTMTWKQYIESLKGQEPCNKRA